jgi:hypothetical protein
VVEDSEARTLYPARGARVVAGRMPELKRPAHEHVLGVDDVIRNDSVVEQDGDVAVVARDPYRRGRPRGLAERVFGAGQALWPLPVVVSCRFAAKTGADM